jgi:phosphoglycolate phosphatase
MQLPRLVVFDLDGTLIDSSLDLCNSVNAALRHVGRPTLPNELIAGYIGDGAAMLVRRALGDPGDFDSLQPDEALLERTYSYFIEYYRQHKLDNTRCYDGVLEALQTIRDRQPTLPMAVLTNKPVVPSRDICAALRLAPFFFQNYGGNSFKTKKPDPEGLLAIIAEARDRFDAELTPAQTVMVGDSDVDVLTARRAGARAIGCSFGLAPHTLEAAEPDAIVAGASDWPAALGLQLDFQAPNKRMLDCD